MKEKIITILGGDTRQIALAKQLNNQGYSVNLYGLSENEDKNNLKIILKNSQLVVFPMPISKNGEDLYTNFSTKKIKLVEINKEKILNNKIIFIPGLKSNELESLKIGKCNKIFKYCTEDFLVRNAYLTAKATTKIIKKNIGLDLKNKKILICGFGRLGKELTKILKDKSNNLLVSARKETDLNEIKSLSIKCINTNEIEKTSGYDIIVNTVPALIFNENVLKKSAKNALLIDLASNPGGVDKKAVKKLAINHIHALGLPGKFYPEESAKIIKDNILKVMTLLNSR